VTRLIDMGLEPFLVASTVEALMAQRLVRRVCASCQIRRPPTPEEQAIVGERVADLATVVTAASPPRGRSRPAGRGRSSERGRSSGRGRGPAAAGRSRACSGTRWRYSERNASITPSTNPPPAAARTMKRRFGRIGNGGGMAVSSRSTPAESSPPQDDLSDGDRKEMRRLIESQRTKVAKNKG
jgi:hypothetical protein